VSVPAAASTFSFPVRVYYEDTDAAGVVYYANYLRFMERARTEWLTALGFDVAQLERDHRVAFVVHRADVEFHAPARLSDRLDVTLALVERGRARFVAEQQVRRDGRTLVRGRITLACVDSQTWRPARIPAPVATRLELLA
jgi:acyl-CoA thioester hydrolase